MRRPGRADPARRRRARAQARLLAAVLALVVAGVTPLGIAALLIGPSQQRAFDVAMAAAPAADVDAVGFVTRVPGAAAADVVTSTRGALAGVLSPLPAATTVTASAATRELVTAPGGTGVGYLGAAEGLAGRVRVVAGRLPRPGAAVPEAAVPQAAATALRLAPGDVVGLGTEVTNAEVAPVRVRIVGVFAPLPTGGWDRDPLGGAGTARRYFASGRLPSVPAFGPFLVDLADLVRSGSTLDRLGVTAHPDLSRPSRPALEAVVSTFGSANARLTTAVGGRATVARVESALPATLAAVATQEAVTRAAVLVVVLLALALSVTALALAGRLVEALRAPETALLASLGASGRQFVVVSGVEAAAIAVVAAAVAVPLAGLAHAALTHLPMVRGAGLAAGAGSTSGSVAAIAAGAALLAGLLVVPALRPRGGTGAPSRGRPGLVVRSGADVLVLALAVIGWWQLRAQPPVTPRTDVVRVVAPVLCLVAGALLALRVVPLVLDGADLLARRARALILPLAAIEAARRPQAAAAALLVVLGAAAGSFGPALLATWDRAQHDQGDLRVGTDLSLLLATPPAAGDAARVAAATGGTVSAAVRRNVLVGHWVDPGVPPQLVAVDARHAAQLMRGRPPLGTTWADVAAPLAPRDQVSGVPVAAGGVPTVTGTASGHAPILAAPRFVLQGTSGERVTLDADPVPLDGRPHRLALGAPLAAGQVIAVDMVLSYDTTSTQAPDEGAESSAVTVDVRLPGATTRARAWPAASVGTLPGRLAGPEAALVPVPGGTVLRTAAAAVIAELPGPPADLVATAFAAPGPLPVVVSRSVAAAAEARVGGPLTLTLGTTELKAAVTRVVPDVPSVPGRPAVLADTDLLSRALLAAGDLSPATNAWWVAGPTAPDAAGRARALGLGTVLTRAGTTQELSAGPLRVLFPVALGALVPVALLLVLAGAALNVTADLEGRGLEVARLRAVGVRRGQLSRGLMAQHAGVLTLLVTWGAVVGWAGARLLGPLLVRSDVGGVPVPEVTTVWPWAALGTALAAYLVGCALVVAVVVGRELRRAETAHLRVGET